MFLSWLGLRRTRLPIFTSVLRRFQNAVKGKYNIYKKQLVTQYLTIQADFCSAFKPGYLRLFFAK